jgi:hypothetical protein
MQGSTATDSAGEWFKPTLGRLSFAALLAFAGFLLPQEVPLEWYPLNNPGNDINYLEISCAANATGEVKIFYDLTRGINELDCIRWPISATSQTYTYTFPLPDAPIVELQMHPLSKGGELNIRQMRIINRRGEEIRRFTRDMFQAQQDIAAISPTVEGWKLISTPAATDPITRIDLLSPIIPVGKDHRNLLRCLLSTGYLAGMLLILLLAVLFTFFRPAGWRDLLAPLGFMACLAVFFALVGNRGLIRNSLHYARYIPPPAAPGLRLEFDLLTSSPSTAQLFWDTGHGYNEAESIRQKYEPHQGLQVLRFPLPDRTLRALRFDPRDGEGRLDIRGIRVVDAGQRTHTVIPFDSLLAAHDIVEIKTTDEQLTVHTSPGFSDPQLEFTPTAVAGINLGSVSAPRTNR